MDENEPNQQAKKVMEIFYIEEVRYTLSIAKYYLDWLMDDNSYSSTSGNSMYLEKKGNMIIIGNLFDESFPLVEIPKQEVIDFINSGNVSK